MEQLQLQRLRKTMKRYLQTVEVKDWMRLRRRKSVQMIHPAPSALSSLKDPRVDDRKIAPHVHRHPCLVRNQSFVNLECHAFPRYKTQRAENERNLQVNRRSRQCQDRVRASGPVALKPTSSTKKVDCPFTEPEGSRELGRFRKRVEKSKTCRRSTVTVGCESLTSTRQRSTKGKPQSGQVGTGCSSTDFLVQNLKCDYEGTTTPTSNLETRPASMRVRRKLNGSTLMEELKRQRPETAKQAQAVNALDLGIADLTSANNRNTNRNESRAGAVRNEYKHFTSCSETPTRSYFQGKRFGLEECNVDCSGTTRPSYQIESERAQKSMISILPQNSRPLAAASRTTAIFQDALDALECAHRWNEWGARTLHQLARASKAALVERNHHLLLLLDWPRRKPELHPPHDNDITTSTHRGSVLESREEERMLIRDLVAASGLTNRDSVDKSLLTAQHQHVVEQPCLLHKSTIQPEQKYKMDKHLLYDFVEELVRHELVVRSSAEPGTYLIHKRERTGQAFVQKIWNTLQSYDPSPASEGTCTAEQNLAILQRDLKAQEPTFVEVGAVVGDLEEMIYQSLVQELLGELKQVPGDRFQNRSQAWHTCMQVETRTVTKLREHYTETSL